MRAQGFMMYFCLKVAPAHHAETFRVEFKLGPRETCNAAERNRAQVHLKQNKMKRRFTEKNWRSVDDIEEGAPSSRSFSKALFRHQAAAR